MLLLSTYECLHPEEPNAWCFYRDADYGAWFNDDNLTLLSDYQAELDNPVPPKWTRIPYGTSQEIQSNKECT